LATELTDELVREGVARDVVRAVQDRRKELDLEYNDRIDVGIVTGDPELTKAIKENSTYIQQETLAASLQESAIAAVEATEVSVGDYTAQLFVSPVLQESKS
jgi:isoleucyl-tRNA synthetase